MKIVVNIMLVDIWTLVVILVRLPMDIRNKLLGNAGKVDHVVKWKKTRLHGFPVFYGRQKIKLSRASI